MPLLHRHTMGSCAAGPHKQSVHRPVCAAGPGCLGSHVILGSLVLEKWWQASPTEVCLHTQAHQAQVGKLRTPSRTLRPPLNGAGFWDTRHTAAEGVVLPAEGATAPPSV